MSVDWAAQWAQFAPNFSNGAAHIDLSPYGAPQILRLKPGAGFGDLSHPTTALMLTMMASRVHRSSVIDIGSGSGILTLAAILLGASRSIGIEIDLEAIFHAKENAALNELRIPFYQQMPAKLPNLNIFLINMIASEQRIALKEIKSYNKRAKLWLVSGILEEQEESYLEETKSWGWKLQERFVDRSWVGYIFGV